MSIQLSLDEMLDCLITLGDLSAAHYQRLVEALGTLMAEAIATRLNVRAGRASFQGLALAGTCAPFRAAFSGQSCPTQLQPYDPDGWN